MAQFHGDWRPQDDAVVTAPRGSFLPAGFFASSLMFWIVAGSGKHSHFIRERRAVDG
jgi:hypothetical protein